ncbi:MAG: tetratricopeptide repeat protein [Planctomycetota bacterium]
MSQKSAIKRTLPRKDKKIKDAPTPTEEPVVEEQSDDPELIMDKLRPHMSTIVLVVTAVSLAIVAFIFYRSATFQTEAIKWVELNQAKAINDATGDVKSLNQVADEFGDSTAGLVSAFYAGDSQMRKGIQQLATDREGGFGLVKRAKTNFQSIVDADPKIKTPWLSQKALFNLAYACETLGQFSDAKKHYGELLEQAPDSPLAQRAQRGLDRSSNDQFIAMYQKFKEYESTIGSAPGPLTDDPTRPSAAIGDFEGTDLLPGMVPPTDSPLDKKKDTSNTEGPESEDPKSDSPEKEDTTANGDGDLSETVTSDDKTDEAPKASPDTNSSTTADPEQSKPEEGTPDKKPEPSENQSELGSGQEPAGESSESTGEETPSSEGQTGNSEPNETETGETESGGNQETNESENG